MKKVSTGTDMLTFIVKEGLRLEYLSSQEGNHVVAAAVATSSTVVRKKRVAPPAIIQQLQLWALALICASCEEGRCPSPVFPQKG